MVIEAIRRLVESLDLKIDEADPGKPFFSDPRYETYPITVDRFHRIERKDSHRRLVFIDGGNQEVLGTANYSIQANRVYFNVFDGHDRLSANRLPPRIDFFSATNSVIRSGEIFFETAVFPAEERFKEFLPSEKDLAFDSFDRTLREGLERVDVAKAASMARRFAELQYAYRIILDEMERGDILVLDGSLQTSFTNEADYAKRVFEAAKSKGVIVTGLSKTSRLFTTTGLALLGAAQKVAHQSGLDVWYILLAESKSTDHNAAIFGVKLNAVTDYVFRFEVYYDQYESMGPGELMEVLWRLTENSSDISFPGYPYGLVDADRFARVRFDEAESYYLILLSELIKAGKKDKFVRYIRTIDAHSILDKLADER